MSAATKAMGVAPPQLTGSRHPSGGDQLPEEDKWQMIREWQESERRLQRACDQLDLLSDAITDVSGRLVMARRGGQEVIGLTLGMRLQVLEGVHQMYYVYADHKAERMSDLWEGMCRCPGFDLTDVFGEEVEDSLDQLNVA